MKIAICDDEKLCVEELFALVQNYINENNIDADICCFSTGQAFLQSDYSDYDLVFLDVNLDTMNGIDVAKQLRLCNSTAILIYVSELLEYSPMGYEVNAFRYLLKCDLKKLFIPCMLAVMQELKKRKQTFPIKTDSGNFLVPIVDIIFVESKKRQVIFHLTNNDRTQYVYYDKLSSVEEKLAPVGFVRIQKSFLVNMEHIELINSSKVKLSNQAELSISELSSKEVIHTYSLWKGRL